MSVLFEEGQPVLTDGGIETRVMFETDVAMDPYVQVAGMVSDPEGRRVLDDIYASYVDAASGLELPVVIGTPTFRASSNFASRAGMGAEAVVALNTDAVAMQRELRSRAGSDSVLVAGVIGPSGDAYEPADALAPADARAYHSEQAGALAAAGVDFLFAATFPAVGEALGAAQAMAQTGIPHVVSFVLEAGGDVLDRTPLDVAIARLEAEALPQPVHYSLSCVHPRVAARGLEKLERSAPQLLARLREVKANASSLTPDELVRLDHPAGDEPEPFADAMWSLHERFGVRVLGGCCGTDHRHMRALAGRLCGL